MHTKQQQMDIMLPPVSGTDISLYPLPPVCEIFRCHEIICTNRTASRFSPIHLERSKLAQTCINKH